MPSTVTIAAAIARSTALALDVAGTFARAITRTRAFALTVGLARIFASRTRTTVWANSAVGVQTGLLTSNTFFFGLWWSAVAFTVWTGLILRHPKSSADEEDGQHTGHGFRFHDLIVS